MEKAIRAFDVEAVAAVADKSSIKRAEFRILCENALKREFGARLLGKATSDERLDFLTAFLDFDIRLAEMDLVPKNSPVLVVLAEAFETSSIMDCERLFKVVEERTAVWTSALFFEAIRNHLLRVCNELLRRLSRTLDTLLAGRILIFLARTLPLTERSGLNLVGTFNVDNRTLYEAEDAEEEEVKPEGPSEMEEGEMDENAGPAPAHSSVPVDHGLYVKFWQLQDAFSTPNNCFDKPAWKLFQRNANDVLSVLQSYKLEPPQSAAKSSSHASAMETDDDKAAEVLRRRSTMEDKKPRGYFAKFLTSHKLLQLQLNDSSFRRYVLVQFLILAQYLQTESRFKDKKSLDEASLRWVRETVAKIHRLLEETYPDGGHFSEGIKLMLEREEKWNEWKNAGCADITGRADAAEKMPVFKRRPRAKFDPARLDLGNPELTRLWNIEPDNMAACRSAKRKFRPDLAEFLEDPWEQADPAAGIEKAYKLVENESWRWAASRLLLESTPVFLTETPEGGTNAQIKNVPTHIERIVLKAASELPKFQKLKEQRASARAAASKESAAAEAEERLREAAAVAAEERRQAEGGEISFGGAKDGDEAEEEEEEEGQIGGGGDAVTEATLEDLAKLIGDDWRKLAKEMDLDAATIKAFALDEGEAAALALLQQWTETAGPRGSAKALRFLLLKAELFNEDINTLLSHGSHANTPDTN